MAGAGVFISEKLFGKLEKEENLKIKSFELPKEEGEKTEILFKNKEEIFFDKNIGFLVGSNSKTNEVSLTKIELKEPIIDSKNLFKTILQNPNIAIDKKVFGKNKNPIQSFKVEKQIAPTLNIKRILPEYNLKVKLIEAKIKDTGLRIGFELKIGDRKLNKTKNLLYNYF